MKNYSLYFINQISTKLSRGNLLAEKGSIHVARRFIICGKKLNFFAVKLNTNFLRNLFISKIIRPNFSKCNTRFF